MGRMLALALTIPRHDGITRGSPLCIWQLENYLEVSNFTFFTMSEDLYEIH